MSDLISRQAAIKAIEKNMYPDSVCSLNVYKGYYTAGLQTAVTVVDNLPAAEPERKTGKWVTADKGLIVTSYKCSECGRTVRDNTGYDVTKDYPYCHCGAKMENADE